MHAYGYSRTVKLSCRWGCCQRDDARRNSSHRVNNDRARRKAARQQSQQLVRGWLFPQCQEDAG